MGWVDLWEHEIEEDLEEENETEEDKQETTTVEDEEETEGTIFVEGDMISHGQNEKGKGAE